MWKRVGMLGVHHPEAVPLIDMCRRVNEDLGYWLSAHGQWVPDTLSTLIYHETTAAAVTTYEPLLVPGYLQTERYARAVIGRETWRSEAELDSSVRLRIDRQRILDPRHRARHVFYLHEQALRLEVGGRDVMYEQMIALALACSAPNLVVRAIPASAGARSIFGGGFHLFGYREHDPLVYLDGYTTGLFIEDADYVRHTEALLTQIADVALDAEESRKFLAALADEYDRGSDAHVGGRRVEEEQL